MIIQNAIKIVENWPEISYLVSSHVHDFQTYIFKDGKFISVDGGRDYLKRYGNATYYLDGYPGRWTEWNLDDKDTFDTVKECLLWGSRGKTGREKLKHLLIKDLELGHLKDIIHYADKNNLKISKIHLKVIKYWIKEKSKNEKKS